MPVQQPTSGTSVPGLAARIAATGQAYGPPCGLKGAADAASGNGFDLAHARLMLSHMSGYAAGLAAMARAALRPGGWLLAESADPRRWPAISCPLPHKRLDQHCGSGQILIKP